MHTAAARAPRQLKATIYTPGTSLDLLAREWVHLQTSAPYAGALKRWAAHSPLTTWPTIEQALEACGDRGDDTVLRALLGYARAGDQEAHRLVLQSLLPHVVGLACRTRHHHDGDVDEAQAVALLSLLELMRTIQLVRKGCLRQAIALGVLHQLTGGSAGHRHRQATTSVRIDPVGSADDVEQHAQTGLPADDPYVDVSDPRALSRDTRSDEHVLHLLAWACRTDVLAGSEARLLWDLHSPGVDGAAMPTQRHVVRVLAENRQISPTALRQRACRARRKLLAALQSPES